MVPIGPGVNRNASAAEGVVAVWHTTESPMTGSKQQRSRDAGEEDARKETEQPQKQPSGETAKPGRRGDQSRDPQGGRV